MMIEEHRSAWIYTLHLNWVVQISFWIVCTLYNSQEAQYFMCISLQRNCSNLLSDRTKSSNHDSLKLLMCELIKVRFTDEFRVFAVMTIKPLPPAVSLFNECRLCAILSIIFFLDNAQPSCMWWMNVPALVHRQTLSFSTKQKEWSSSVRSALWWRCQVQC